MRTAAARIGAAWALARHKQVVYAVRVTRSFANRETRQLFADGRCRRLPSDIHSRAARRLTQLDAATQLDDLSEPRSKRLEALSGDRVGQCSIRINEQWRLCFRFDQGDAFDVEIVDYH